jgi:hypothetical protein
MMNMFKLSEQLKDFSKDQLVREMKMPSGSVPQFLVLTELQRRTRMEREAQGGDAPEQSTVAQDAVAAAGVPQGGVAQMAQALAPKTDMAGNTGIAAMAPQAAPAPAPVQRMQEGGGIGGVPSIAETLADIADYFRGVSLGIGGAMGGSAAGLVPSGMLNRVSPTDTPPARPEVSDDPTGRGERPDTSRFEAATLGLGADQEFAEPPTGRGYFPRTEDILQGIATGATFGGAALPLVNPDMAYDVGTSVFGEEPFRRAGIIDPARRRLAEQFEEEAEAADREIADLPGGVAPDLGIETPAAPAAPGGGGGGGAGGGGSRTGTLGDIDRMYEQDKWLSLARFGLGLMASSQPTLGGAIGEAGGAALDSLGQAREDLLQRRMAEAQLARRGGGGGDDIEALPIGLATMYDDEIASLREQLNSLAVANNPTLRTQIDDRLEELEAQQNYTRSLVLASRGIPPRTAGAPDSIPDFSD